MLEAQEYLSMRDGTLEDNMLEFAILKTEAEALEQKLYKLKEFLGKKLKETGQTTHTAAGWKLEQRKQSETPKITKKALLTLRGAKWVKELQTAIEQAGLLTKSGGGLHLHRLKEEEPSLIEDIGSAFF